MTYFLKLNKHSTWQDILENKLNNKEYSELIKITIPDDEFQYISENLYKPHFCYAQYAKQSVANGRDKLPCIIIQGETNNKRLIFYTGGRVHPLYVAAEE